MSPIRTDIIQHIECFLAETGMSADRFSRRALGDHKLMARLRSEKSVHLTRIELAFAFITAERFQRDQQTLTIVG